MIVYAIIDQNGRLSLAVSRKILCRRILFKIADDRAAAGVALPQKQNDLDPLPVSARQGFGELVLGIHIHHHGLVDGRVRVARAFAADRANAHRGNKNHT